MSNQDELQPSKQDAPTNVHKARDPEDEDLWHVQGNDSALLET